MKPRILFTTFALAVAGWLMPPSAAIAGLPQPMCVYYGQARDGYGLPYLQGADVILRRGTTEIARHSIRGSLSPGVNFALYAHLDDGGGTRSYSPRALHGGDLVSIVVRDRDGEKAIMENQAVPPVGSPGELILFHVTASDDADRDGLPDTWEAELIAWSGGQLRNLADVSGGEDFDGDGVSNWREYLAGTFAFFNDDYLSVAESVSTSSGCMRLTFLSVAGKAYSVRSATDLTQATWTPCLFGVVENGPLQLTPVEGNGDWFSVYVPVGESSRFLRLIVE